MSFAYAKAPGLDPLDDPPSGWPSGTDYPPGIGTWLGLSLATGAYRVLDESQYAGLSWPSGFPATVSGLTVTVDATNSAHNTGTQTVDVPIEVYCQISGADTSQAEFHLVQIDVEDSVNPLVQVHVQAHSSDPLATAVVYQMTNYSGSRYGISRTVRLDFTNYNNLTGTNPWTTGFPVEVTATVMTVSGTPSGTDGGLTLS